uniref:Non-haem dioxygenase N-terminal domain-containing protein n=1 Tax=Trieres chinensis TaxID=1514140 RepID=A0A6U1X1B8_TRICV|mmetsp:Transcript_32004/g.65327  ORF Transcript_32004/g.65327 Transcript_32004/m.65327 type:complete len:408 (+) Transcript_32004:142-1365(+)|eukprot:CAMPEP_0183322990 /NCGR_PEP_ID=MMETSP0160_2-20130417/73260_1 /TAXON_ID=2839 ORGANISM="Odontella Sinensis, Strain Grunow 1884" /NCGR_SAMPLE_ID=MMETSP0160_2 /ASSEMBLY_ACC=CAM_ASM_000250 /LENGTH=407 /DNA_ID=CAMNT_0025490277 /DNA_START=100 /DNA_END=1323 /DNA_ORIENTATION=+
MDKGSVVKISYRELIDLSEDNLPSLTESLSKAFGSSESSLGILAVSDVPGFASLRRRLLPLSRRLAELPTDCLESVTNESAGYQVGWSHGKEKVEGNKFDIMKGSFYANPITDNLLESIKERRRFSANSTSFEEVEPVSEEELEQVAKANPAFFAPNVWPVDSLPELEPAIKEMGQLIHSVGRKVAKLCDAYVSMKCPSFKTGKLESLLTTSLCCKARLLHYFPAKLEENQEKESILGNENTEDDLEFSDWCGWHNDHGSLTGLVPAMYIDVSGTEIKCPCDKAGLYIKSRGGDLVQVLIPDDCLAFQVGETMQIHTGGVLQATPHAVHGCHPKSGKEEGITREAFAVFMEPEYHGDMCIPKERSILDAQSPNAAKNLPRTVKTLKSRWRPGMNFGQFSDATFAAFH